MELKFKVSEGLLIISAVRKNKPSAHILFRENRAGFWLCFSSGYAWDFLQISAVLEEETQKAVSDQIDDPPNPVSSALFGILVIINRFLSQHTWT